MASYYDDNFGAWDDMDEGEDAEDNRKFYQQLQATNVRKKCKGCNRWVNIQPHYAYCNSCATKLERGYDLD